MTSGEALFASPCQKEESMKIGKCLFIMLTLSLIVVAAGLYRVVATTDFVMLINVSWVAYHSLLLGSVFYFNRSFHGYPDTRIFPIRGALLRLNKI